MVSAAPQVYIQQADIRSALEFLRNPTDANVTFDSLAALVLVDRFLADPDMPRIKNARQYAVLSVLSEAIEEKLNEQRQILDLSGITNGTGRRSAIADIQRDAQVRSPQLTGWSLLYYCYVRADLNISMEDYASACGVVLRTLRRYRSTALILLSDCLTKMEREARVQLRKVRLLAQLPSPEPRRLIGREGVTKRTLEAVRTKHDVTILVSGARGVGKTTFVQEVLRTFIEEYVEHFHSYVIWCSAPQTISEVIDNIEHEIVPVNATVTLRQLLLVHRVIVVVDTIENLEITADGFSDLLELLQPASVILTSSRYVAHHHIDMYVHLPELSHNDAIELINAYRSLDIGIVGNEHINDVEDILRHAGGNPNALRLYLQNSRLGDVSINTSPIDQLFDEALMELDDRQVQTWAAIALCGADRRIAVDDLKKLWPDVIDLESIRVLARKFLVDLSFEVESKRLTISPASQQYVLRRLSGVGAGTFWDHCIDVFASYVEQSPELALSIIQNLLDFAPLDLETDVIAQWLARILAAHSEITDNLVWFRLLRRLELEAVLNEVSPQMRLQHSILLRRLGRWSDAQEGLHTVIVDCGEAGDFRLQSWAQLELSVLYRLAGAYEQSLHLLDRLQEKASRYQDTELSSAVLLELAQIGLDAQDARLAEYYIEQVSSEYRGHTRGLFMKAEAFFQGKRFDEAIVILKSLCSQIDDDRAFLGRVYDLLGRISFEENEFAESNHYFSTAISYFDTEQDVFTRARGQSNLGAAQLRLGNYSSAEEHLKHAHDVQSHLNDRVGLIATEANLKLLRDNDHYHE